MTRHLRMLAAVLCLVGCQTTPGPSAHSDWPAWFARVDALDSANLEIAQTEALRQYTIDPTAGNRLRAGYALSRAGASLAQLEQARGILTQIPADSELAAYRVLLDNEVQLRMELRRAQLRLTEQQLEVERLTAKSSELQRRTEGLLSQVRDLQTQIEALKAIEENMVESQQQSDEMQR